MYLQVVRVVRVVVVHRGEAVLVEVLEVFLRRVRMVVEADQLRFQLRGRCLST